MEESCKALNEDLLLLMNRQSEEHPAFIKQLEEVAKAKKCRMVMLLELLSKSLEASYVA